MVTGNWDPQLHKRVLVRFCRCAESSFFSFLEWLFPLCPTSIHHCFVCACQFSADFRFRSPAWLGPTLRRQVTFNALNLMLCIALDYYKLAFITIGFCPCVRILLRAAWWPGINSQQWGEIGQKKPLEVAPAAPAAYFALWLRLIGLQIPRLPVSGDGCAVSPVEWKSDFPMWSSLGQKHSSFQVLLGSKAAVVHHRSESCEAHIGATTQSPTITLIWMLQGAWRWFVHWFKCVNLHAVLTAATIVQAGAADLSWDWPPGCGQVVAKGGVGAEMMRMMVLLAEFSLLMQATWESELSIFMKQDRSIDSCHLISNDCLCHAMTVSCCAMSGWTCCSWRRWELRCW